ncbi:protein enabled homolog isoform X2 [Manacus candei]|uniref:protein enabled homolog isoform X2 n=1 Tax=Manacus candei TaxID=415023 RepID=UPI00222691E9|nr:protein enabled homolog isoform X2 [Manacus candei]
MVLMRRPSSFPGIKEPTQSGGIPRSEAKALLECRRLVPPAGGRLLQGTRAGRRPERQTDRQRASQPCLGFLLPGDGGAVPCPALPIARGWRSCALELCPALPCRGSPHSGAQAIPPAAAGLPAQPVAAGMEQLRARASIGNQMDLSREQGSSAKRTSQGWEPATGTAVGTDKGQPAAPQPGLLWTGPLRCLTLDTPQRQPRRTQRIQPALGSVGTAGLQSSAGSRSQGPPPRAPPRPPRVSRPPQIPALPAGGQQPAAALKPGPCALSGTKSRARALGDA